MVVRDRRERPTLHKPLSPQYSHLCVRPSRTTDPSTRLGTLNAGLFGASIRTAILQLIQLLQLYARGRCRLLQYRLLVTDRAGTPQGGSLLSVSGAGTSRGSSLPTVSGAGTAYGGSLLAVDGTGTPWDGSLLLELQCWW